MLDEKGFLRPTYDDIVKGKIQRAKVLFGDDVDTSDTSILGKYIRLNAYDLAEAYEVLEQLYYSNFPMTAQGVSLDRLSPSAGITRNPATVARHQIRITGTPEHVVDMGFLVGTASEVLFHTTEDVALDAQGVGVVEVDCNEAGTMGNVALGTIAQIVNPDANVTAVAHVGVVDIGVDVESDAALRNRYAESLAGIGSSNLDAIRGAMRKIPGVQSVTVIENDADTTDAMGRPPHTFQCYVYGGDGLDDEIAQAIFDKKPLGIRPVGDVTGRAVDLNGEAHMISFSRTEEIAVWVRVKLLVGALFPDDGVARVKQHLLAAIHALTGGQDLVYAKLYGVCYAVEGVEDIARLTLSTDQGQTYVAQNVTCQDWQAVTTDLDHIWIEVTSHAE